MGSGWRRPRLIGPKRDARMVTCPRCRMPVRAYRLEEHPETAECRLRVVSNAMAERDWHRIGNYGKRVDWLAVADIPHELDLAGVVPGASGDASIYKGWWAPSWAVWVVERQDVTADMRRAALLALGRGIFDDARAWVEEGQRLVREEGLAARILGGDGACTALLRAYFRQLIKAGTT